MAERYRNYIGGQWVEPRSGEWLPNKNPANTDDLIGEWPASNRDDGKAAIDAARQALPEWKARPAPDRGRLLLKVIALCNARKQEIAAALCREEGKILKEALGEVTKGINLLEFYAGQGFRVSGNTRPSEMGEKTFLYTVREPLGVVSLITPWNFPFAIPAWKIAPAIVAGNTVVLKPSEYTPHTAHLLTEIFEEAGLPAGVLNVVHGLGEVVGDEIVKNEGIDGISFTGSNAVGTAVNQAASARGIKVTCEMGGKNAAIVMDDADFNLALEGVFLGAFGSTGQRCTATSRLVLQRGIAESFMAALKTRAEAITIGDGSNPDIAMGPIINQAQLDHVMACIARGKETSARLITGGDRASGGALDRGYFVQPTIFTDVSPEMSLWQEEIFGPVLSVTTVDSFQDALDRTNNTRYGLTSAIYTNDISQAMAFVNGVEVGMVHVNNPTIGGEAQVPFGGIKATGIGDREMAEEGFDFFTETKTVFLDYTGKKRDTNIY